MEKRVLIVPGLRGSGPRHWQTRLQAQHPEFRRVLQHDWLAPRLADWAAVLDEAIRAERNDVFIAAHGFGCLAALEHHARGGTGVLGAMLVAPRRPEEFGFAPQRLDIPAIVVASRSDAWLPFAEARQLARVLEARFVDAGDAGHIDALWPGAERILARLFAMAQARSRELRVALALAS